MGTLIEVGLWNAAAAALLALVAAGVSRLCRKPALAHTLWLLVLLKLVTPPLVPCALPWPGGAEPAALAAEDPPIAAEAPAFPAGLDGDWQHADPREQAEEAGAADVPEAAPVPSVGAACPWHWWTGGVWLTGLVLWSAWVTWHVLRFRRVLRLARLAPGSLQEEAEDLARRLGLRRCPDVWLVPGAVSPMVWALGRRPCLLFPSGLLNRLDGQGRAALLAHELAHVRRRDHWVRLLELAATGLYWWLPVLWWARRELHEAEEQCCDAWGVWALGGDGRPYALALLQAASFVSRVSLPLPAGASGVGPVSHLKRRLAMVMQGKTSRSLSWAGLGVVLGVGLLLLPLFPARGQQPAPAATPAPVPVGQQDARDQDIDALKRAIKLLEDQKRAEQAGAAPLRRWAAAPRVPQEAPAEDVLNQLKVLDQQIATKRKELRDLEAKAQDLRAKMKAPGSPPAANQFYRTPAAVPPPKAPEGRVDELEKKLDRLQKDLEELRRELKRKPGTPAFGPQPIDNVPRPGALLPTPAAAPPANFVPAPDTVPGAPVTLPPSGALPPSGDLAPPGALPSPVVPPPATVPVAPVTPPPADVAPPSPVAPAPATRTVAPLGNVAPPGATPPPPAPLPPGA
jgi:beta-lactamase regulating signal transducer with metallopeptidase domain